MEDFIKLSKSYRRFNYTSAFLVISILSVQFSSAADYQTQAFPAAHELFAQLQADPSEPRFEFSFGFPVSGTAFARIDAGDYLGVYRWAVGEHGALQLNIGGSIDTRFDATTDHNLNDVDFYGNVPLDFRLKWFTLRSMFYHDSSHIGDDYLRRNNFEDQNNSWEAWRETASFQVFKAFRLYAGYQQATHTKPDWQGRKAYQGGAEYYFNTAESGFWHPYFATDVQAWARSNYDVTVTSQLGFKTGDEYSRGRGISYFLQFSNGPRYEGQFYSKQETVWGLGLKFALSDRPLQPSPEPAAPAVPLPAPGTVTPTNSTAPPTPPTVTP